MNANKSNKSLNDIIFTEINEPLENNMKKNSIFKILDPKDVQLGNANVILKGFVEKKGILNTSFRLIDRDFRNKSMLVNNV